MNKKLQDEDGVVTTQYCIDCAHKAGTRCQQPYIMAYLNRYFPPKLGKAMRVCQGRYKVVQS